MKIINNKTVVLTDEEALLQARFEQLLSSGHSIYAAANRIREQNNIDPAFYRWLTDEPLLQDKPDNIPLGLFKWCVARLSDSRESGEVDKDVSDAVIEREAAKLETLIFQLASSFIDNEFNEKE